MKTGLSQQVHNNAIKLARGVASFFVNKNGKLKHSSVTSSVIAVTLIVSLMISLFSANKIGRAQNYDKIWTSTADFNSGTNSNVDTGGDEAKLATTTTNFSESFIDTTHKDAATDANWDTAAHRLSLPGDPTNGVSTDLQAKWKATVGVNAAIIASAYDSVNNVIYLSDDSGSFGMFSPSSNTVTDLKPIAAAAGVNPSSIYSMVFDSENRILYFGGYSKIFAAFLAGNDPYHGSVINLSSKIPAWSNPNIYVGFDSINKITYLVNKSVGNFASFNGGSDPANGILTDLTSKISGDIGSTQIWGITFDSINGKIYIGGDGAKFGAFAGGSDPANGTWVYLNSKITGSWSTSNIYALTFDSVNGIVYLGGSSAKFGAFAGGSDPANGTFSYLNAKISANWGSDNIFSMGFDSANAKIYIGESGSANPKFGAYTGGSDPANGTWVYLLTKISTDFGSSTNLNSITFNSNNSKVYLGGSRGNYGALTGGSDPANGTWTNLSTNVAELFFGHNITASTYDSVNGIEYFGGSNGKFMAYKPSDGTVWNLTSKISSAWSTSAINGMAVDSNNGFIYFGGAGSKIGAFSINAVPSSGTFVNLTAKINFPYTVRCFAFDTLNGKMYIAGGDTWPALVAFTGGSDPANGAAVVIGNMSTNFSSTAIYSLAYDCANQRIYVGSSGGSLGSLTANSDAATDAMTMISGKISGNWSSNSIAAMTYDAANSRIYLGGANGRFGTFIGGSDPANGTFTYLTTQLTTPDFDNASFWSTSSITSMSYSMGKIFIGGASGKFGVMDASASPASVTNWNYLFSNISSINYANQINTMTFVPSSATLYLGSATGNLTSFLVGYQSGKSGISLTVDSTSQSIYKATLTATENKPTDTDIVYYLSNDGGAHWNQVSSGLEHTFTITASDLRWKALLSTTNLAITPELTGISISYKYFPSNSGTMDLLFDADQAVTPTLLTWTHALPSNTNLNFKLRSASSQDGLASATWSDIKNAADTPVNLKIINVGSAPGVPENQFFEVLVTFTTADGMNTPVISDLTMQYVINQPPAIQNVVADQRTDGSKIFDVVYELRDPDTHTNPYNQDGVSVSLQYSVNSGQNWNNCTTTTGTGLQAVNADGSWKSMSATWNAGTDLADQSFSGTVKLKVLADDNEQAHNTAELSSDTTSLDTLNPAAGSIEGGFTGLKIGSGANWTNDTTPDLTLSADDDTAKTMEIRNDSNFVGTTEAYSTAKTDWALSANDGTKNVFVRFYDAYGNHTDASATVLLDTTAPSTPAHFTLFDTSNSDLGTYTITSIWDPINNPGDFNKYSLERSTNGTDFSELATFSNLAADVYADKDLSPENSYYYRLRTEDIHNNYSSYTEIKDLRPAGTDTVPPEITGPGPTSQAFATTANVTWITSEPADSYVEFGTSESYGSNQGSDELVTNHSVTVIGLQPTTTYHYRVKSRDGNSNKVTSADYTFTTTLPEDSQSSLSITGATAQKPGANPEEVTIIWTTDKYATSQVLYGKTETLGQQTDEDNTLNKTHYVTIGGLEPNTKYYYKARSKDTYGNVVDGETKLFVTAQNDTNSASIAAINFVEISDITMNSAIVSWQTVTVATSAVEIGSGEGYSGRVEDISTGSTTQHVVRLKDLEQGTEYHFRVMGQNAAGAWLASDNYKFSTVPEPAIFQITIKNIASTSATISWKTNVLTDSTVDYGTDNLSLSQGSGVNVTDHEVNLTSLKAATKYQFSIRIRDSFGNSITSVPMDFQTIIDTTGPVIRDMKSETSIITDQTGNTKAQAIISWSTDEPSTAQVKYAMGVAAGSDYPLSTTEDTNLSTSHVVIISNLNPSATYHMKLVSKDASNNISVSDDYTVLTLNQDKSLLQYIVQILEERFSWLKGMGLF